MDFNLYNILIIAGIIQGVIFSLVVFFSPKFRSPSTLALGTLVLTYSLGNLQYILEDIGLFNIVFVYQYIYFPFALLIPSLFYIYVDLYLSPSKKFTPELRRHLYPFLLFLLITLGFRFAFLISEEPDALFSKFRPVVLFVEISGIFYSLAVNLICTKKILNFRSQVLPKLSSDRVKFSVNWLYYTLRIILVCIVIWAYLTYDNLFVHPGETNFYILWIAVATMIYWLGHVGIYKFGILEERKKIRQYLKQSQAELPKKQFSNTRISEFEDILINQKLFLDSTLSLEALASKMGISTGHLSRTIKQELDTNFVDYVNSLRVEEAKSYLLNPDFADYTITAIGLEAGFNSKSTFYDVFKKHTGNTPAFFKRAHLF